MRSNKVQLIALKLLLATAATLVPYAARAETADALLKPPLAEDPRQAVLQKVVRSTYPELFDSSAAEGWVAITLFMNRDGTLNKGYKDDTQTHPYITSDLKAFDALGVDYDYSGDRVQIEMRGGSAGATRIYVRAYFLAPASDPTRDFALLRAKLEERYKSLYRPVSADRVPKLTVMMTESGDIERTKIDSMKSAEAFSLVPSPDLFIAMGIPSDRIGPIGKAMLFEGMPGDGSESGRLLVVYAWPRRAGELAPRPWHAKQGPAAPNDDPAIDRAIAEKYFPDLYTFDAPKYEWPNADFWVLLDQQGQVCATGNRFIFNGKELKLYLESLYPGIQTEGFQPVEFYGERGRKAVVTFMWISKNSPVTDLSRADLSKRDDLALYAGIIGEGTTASTHLLQLKFGSPAIAVSDAQINLEVTATSGGADLVILRARIQQVALKQPGDFEFGASNAVETEWSPESRPVRIRFGRTAGVRLTDGSHRVWQVLFHPDGMHGSLAAFHAP